MTVRLLTRSNVKTAVTMSSAAMRFWGWRAALKSYINTNNSSTLKSENSLDMYINAFLLLNVLFYHRTQLLEQQTRTTFTSTSQFGNIQCNPIPCHSFDAASSLNNNNNNNNNNANIHSNNNTNNNDNINSNNNSNTNNNNDVGVVNNTNNNSRISAYAITEFEVSASVALINERVVCCRISV